MRPNGGIPGKDMSHNNQNGDGKQAGNDHRRYCQAVLKQALVPAPNLLIYFRR
jgi:hypothetical protein